MIDGKTVRKQLFMNDHIWLMAQTEVGEALNLQFVNYPYAHSIYVGYTDISNEGKNATMTSYSGLKYEHCKGMDMHSATERITMSMRYVA